MVNSYFTPFLEEVARYKDGVHPLNVGANKQQVRRLERELGVSLPKRYKEFLMIHNGGELFAVPAGTNLCQIYIPEEGPRRPGIGYLEDSFNKNRKWPGMLDSYLIIADTSYGDCICMDLSTSDGVEASIINWNHELGEVDLSWNRLIDWLMCEMETGKMYIDYDGNEMDDAGVE